MQAVASDRYAMGYSGIGYKTADVRAVPLAAENGKPFVEAVAANGYSGDYPLAGTEDAAGKYALESQLPLVRA